MSVGYGSSFEPIKLSANRVGVIKQIESTSAIGKLSWIMIALEFAASLVPGVGLAATTALGAVGTAAQLGIEAAETGTVSPLSVGVGLGGLALPAVFQGAAFLRNTSKLSGEVQGFIRQATTDLERDIPSLIGRVNKLKDAQIVLPKAEGAEGLLGLITGRTPGATNVGDLLYGLGGTEGNIEKLIRAQQRILDMRKEARGILQNLAGKSRVDPNEFIRATELLQKGNFGTKGFNAIRNTEEFAKLAAGIPRAEEVEESIRLKEEIEDILKVRYGFNAMEMRAAAALIKDGVITSSRKWWKLLRSVFDRTGNVRLGKVIAKGSTQQANKIFKVLTKTETAAAFRSRILKKTISEFQRGVGFITSPSSLIGEIVSKTIGKLSSKWESIGEELGQIIKKAINKGAKGAKQLEEEFEKTGGRVMKSRWIMGYKLINEEVGFHTILIQFKPIPSKNKQPVVATLTGNQLKAFVTAPSKGRWYLDHIARARNGHALDTLDLDLAQYLGFLPVEQIQVIMGLYSASNSLKSAAKSGNMIWGKQYWGGMRQAAISSLISEVGKMAGGTFTSGGEILKTTIEDSVKGVLQQQSIGKSFGEGFRGAFKQDAKRRFEQGSGKNINALRSKVEPIKSMSSIKSVF